MATTKVFSELDEEKYDIEVSDEITVKLVRCLASDDYVVQAAQVSAKGENNPETVSERLINSLMAHRHGSPFEHNSFTFFIEAPVFVIREWQRHRMSSFNEMSGRYTKMKPKFYIPQDSRPAKNQGTSMVPFMVEHPELYTHNLNLTQDAMESWSTYQMALDNGIANEVARIGLPLNIYTQMYWTVNARSLMNFLSLRIESVYSQVMSHPQLEIQMAAEQVEDIFREHMPLTYDSFVNKGRIAP